MRHFVLALAVALPCAAAGAHDFWIEPSTFAPVVAQRVDVGLCEGDGFDCRPLARDGGRIEEFVAIGPGGRQRILGLDGYAPAGIARFATAGAYVVGYRSNRAFTRLDAWRFEQHLAEKGLESIVALRRARGASSAGAREGFTRYAKVLLQVGDAGAPPSTQPLGFRLELSAEFDPYDGEHRKAHAFRLLFEGKPLSGVLVTATRRDAHDRPLEARTDANGRVTYALRDGDAWLLAAVHMIEASRHVDADWESFWASLSFELPEPSVRRASAGTASPAPRGSAD